MCPISLSGGNDFEFIDRRLVVLVPMRESHFDYSRYERIMIFHTDPFNNLRRNVQYCNRTNIVKLRLKLSIPRLYDDKLRDLSGTH